MTPPPPARSSVFFPERPQLLGVRDVYPFRPFPWAYRVLNIFKSGWPKRTNPGSETTYNKVVTTVTCPTVWRTFHNVYLVLKLCDSPSLGEKIHTELIFLSILEIAHFCTESTDPRACQRRVMAPRELQRSPLCTLKQWLLAFLRKNRWGLALAQRVFSVSVGVNDCAGVCAPSVSLPTPPLPASSAALMLQRELFPSLFLCSWWSCIKGILDKMASRPQKKSLAQQLLFEQKLQISML